MRSGSRLCMGCRDCDNSVPRSSSGAGHTPLQLSGIGFGGVSGKQSSRQDHLGAQHNETRLDHNQRGEKSGTRRNSEVFARPQRSGQRCGLSRKNSSLDGFRQGRLRTRRILAGCRLCRCYQGGQPQSHTNVSRHTERASSNRRALHAVRQGVPPRQNRVVVKCTWPTAREYPSFGQWRGDCFILF